MRLPNTVVLKKLLYILHKRDLKEDCPYIVFESMLVEIQDSGYHLED